MGFTMKKYFLIAFSLIAASLFADSSSDNESRASLFGSSESNDKSNPSTLGSLLSDQEHSKRRMPPPNAVFLGSPPTTVELSYTSLILQPTASNLHYAAQADPLPAPTPHWIIHDIETDYTYGFDLGISGNFYHTNTSLSLDWEHFNSNDDASKKLPSSDMIGPFFEIGPDASPYNKAHGQVKFFFDQVNLDYGMFVHFGPKLRTNIFAGIGVAQIKEKLEAKFANPDGEIHRTIKTPSKFLGAGPRFGVNFSYKIFHGFKLEGGFAADLFVGNLKNHTHYLSTSPALAGLGITPPNKQSTTVHERSAVVPGFEGNLCLAYTLYYSKNWMFRIAAGYEAQIYLNAIQTTDIGSEVVTPPVTPDTVGVYARTFQRSTSNFALSGPFVNVTLGF
jgi:hypothetical protein